MPDEQLDELDGLLLRVGQHQDTDYKQPCNNESEALHKTRAHTQFAHLVTERATTARVAALKFRHCGTKTVADLPAGYCGR